MHASIEKLFDLSGRVALVTGGNKGLGREMALGLARVGADLLIASRNVAELQSAAKEIAADTGRRVEWVQTDVSDRSQIAALGKEVVTRMGRVDILINNAGMNQPQAIDEITDDVWDRIVEVNLSSIMALTRAVVPDMCSRKWGRVVHISSIMGIISKDRRNAYSATKRALIGLAQASALDLGAHNVTVNCIAPGPFLTDMPMSLLSDVEKQQFAAMTALNRWGQPSELVGPALFLCSEAASYVTGEVLVVDGGYTIR
ncbi:MAG: SDR family NAD(P)-dependent oxidoreductase [Zavarzinella sp.]